MAGGDSVGLQQLIQDGVAPSQFLMIYASVTAGTATKYWWAGLSALESLGKQEVLLIAQKASAGFSHVLEELLKVTP